MCGRQSEVAIRQVCLCLFESNKKFYFCTESITIYILTTPVAEAPRVARLCTNESGVYERILLGSHCRLRLRNVPLGLRDLLAIESLLSRSSQKNLNVLGASALEVDVALS